MITWEIEDFITYLYQIVADADFETDVVEIDLVKKLIHALVTKHNFSNSYSYETSLNKIKNTQGVSLINAKAVFEEVMPQFDLAKEVKQDILRDLELVAASDNQVSPSERETIAFIKQYLIAVKMPLSW